MTPPRDDQDQLDSPKTAPPADAGEGASEQGASEQGKAATKTSAKSSTNKTKATSGKTAASKKGGAKKGSPKEEPEYESVWSGRLITATTLLLATVLVPVSFLGRLITKESPKSTAVEDWKVGERARVLITVTSADYDKLACLDARPAGDDYCQFKSDREQAAPPAGAPLDDNKLHVLQPYRTTDGQLLLIAGLWATPKVATRLHNEPAAGVAESKLSRYVLDCELEFTEERTGTKIRWSRTEAWSDQGKAFVAEPISCDILAGRTAS